MAKLSEWKKEPCESIILFGKETRGTRKFEVLHGVEWTKRWEQRRFPFYCGVETGPEHCRILLAVAGTDHTLKSVSLFADTTPQEAADELDKMASEMIREMSWFERLEEKV